MFSAVEISGNLTWPEPDQRMFSARGFNTLHDESQSQFFWFRGNDSEILRFWFFFLLIFQSGLDGRVLAVEQNKVLVPGSSNRYLAWGFPDQSFRLGNYESDKAVFICEPSYLIGQVLTCVCPNSKLVISGSSDSVVRIWAFCKKAKQVRIAIIVLKMILLGIYRVSHIDLKELISLATSAMK